MLSATDKKQMRAQGHGLNPVVIIGAKGLTENVLLEVERALNDHELIKIKIASGDRDNRKILIEEICSTSGAETVQIIGRIALIYRKNEQKP